MRILWIKGVLNKYERKGVVLNPVNANDDWRSEQMEIDTSVHYRCETERPEDWSNVWHVEFNNRPREGFNTDEMAMQTYRSLSRRYELLYNATWSNIGTDFD
jgi:hypothetical protein